MLISPKRLRILGKDEIDALYGRPRFTAEERLQYFCLSQPEKDLLEKLRSVKSQAYFILQLGYFKARHLFFTFELGEVEDDLRYVLEQYFKNRKITELSAVDKYTRLKQQTLILELYNYQNCDAQQRQKLELKARQAAQICAKPVYIFREMRHYLAEQRMVSPAYSVMQDTVGKAITYEQNRLITILQNHLKKSEVEALKILLDDSEGLYEITQLKREPKDFSSSEIKREISHGEQIQHLYHLAKKLLSELRISNESIKYYASLVSYYSVYSLKRFEEWLVDVYLLCFVYHRYQKLHDNLIGSLIHHVRRYTDEAKRTAKERVYEYLIESNQNLQKAGQVLKLFTNNSIAEDTPFQQVQLLAFGILERQKLDLIADQIASKTKLDETSFQWEQIDELAHQFKRRLRPILCAVDFAGSLAGEELIEATHFLKTMFQKRKPLGQNPLDKFPLRFIPDTMKRYLYTQGEIQSKQLLPDRYEFLVYRLLRHGLEAGEIFCPDSVRFRSFEDDLLDEGKWQKKEELIAATGFS
jgi:hypothetical protein